jgi:hypothetical protein
MWRMKLGLDSSVSGARRPQGGAGPRQNAFEADF